MKCMIRWNLYFLLLIGLFLAGETNAQMRHSYLLDGEWSFKLERPGSCWEEIRVPHTWNACDGTTPDYYRGKGHYRYQLELTKEMLDQRVFLRFEAASLWAEVKVNNQVVGTHFGGFTAFCFEITPYVCAGENQVDVVVSNAKDLPMAPLSGDFTFFGGIYRPVSLLLLPKMCITPLDHASSGVYIQQETTSALSRLTLVSKVDNRWKTLKDVSVRTSIFDKEGELVDRAMLQQSIKRDTTIDFVTELDVKSPRLWDGRKSPYMYRVFVELLKGKEVVDTLSQYVGLRYFSVDPEKGFFLNGKPYKIRGVNRHQDRMDKGWAISEADHLQDMEIIKEIGANGIRLAHYPHSNYFYSLCDKEGMLVWAEIPLIGHIEPTSEFAENVKNELIDLIRQNYNHPSIFCWSLFNELCKGEVRELVSMLNDVAHQEDPTRLTVAAANIEKRPENTVTDIMAFNTYPGWYWAEPSAMASTLERWNGLVGGKGIAVSEYGGGANVDHHWQTGRKTPNVDGMFHPEEWQSIVHEQNYQAIMGADFVWGSFVWNMFDFASGGRNEGNMPGMNDKGLVTYDRKTKKDAFYFYKSLWTEEPMVYITSRRDAVRTIEDTPIKIYSNCDDVELFVNGKKCASSMERQGNICIWNAIRLAEGENLIEAKGLDENGAVQCYDQCKWFFYKE